jgi:hypothetical protein
MIFYKTKDTISKIKEIIDKEEKGLYLRFGDGDVNLANGNSDSLQSANELVKVEMSQAFAINDKNVLRSLPLHCKEYGLEEGMFPGNHECDKGWADRLLSKVKPFWGGEFGDIYSPVALHFLATVDVKSTIEFLNYMKSKSPVAIIGNENIPSEIISKIFGETCTHIKTPPQNSFSSIDRVESEFKNIYKEGEYNIIITAMGCSGRVLQKRLYNNHDNIFVFDFGSLMDALCGWNTRAWIELTNFDKDKILEKIK